MDDPKFEVQHVTDNKPILPKRPTFSRLTSMPIVKKEGVGVIL